MTPEELAMAMHNAFVADEGEPTIPEELDEALVTTLNQIGTLHAYIDALDGIDRIISDFPVTTEELKQIAKHGFGSLPPKRRAEIAVSPSALHKIWDYLEWVAKGKLLREYARLQRLRSAGLRGLCHRLFGQR